MEVIMLELYYSDTCPYCKKVINYFDENNIEYIPKNVSDAKYYDELMTLGKISQVPFLVDNTNGRMMYESDEIISYAKISEK